MCAKDLSYCAKFLLDVSNKSNGGMSINKGIVANKKR